MKFEEWQPFYDEIIDDFGYSKTEDRESAVLLNGYLEPGSYLSRLRNLVEDKNVQVVGDGPSLDDEIGSIDASRPVVSADGASQRLLDAGIVSDVVCTDLDGAPETAALLSHRETLVAVHAHGDNPDRIENYIEEFDLRNVLGTTQTRPFGNLYNFGGFTDGDRCAFLVDEFGARSIELMGFDFDDPSVDEVKKKKLEWAKLLLEHLEERRDEEILPKI